MNVTSILSTKNTPIEADVSTPTARVKRRRPPETPSNTIDYKESSLNEIERYLVSNSPASKHNSLVISYLQEEISWDSFVSYITGEI